MRITSNLKSWRHYAELKLANLLISRWFDISATDIRALAFYSEKPIVGVDMWSIKGLSKDDAKIMALWFNSSINLLALLINRTETRGAWIKLHEYALREMLALDTKKLMEEEREQTLNLCP